MSIIIIAKIDTNEYALLSTSLVAHGTAAFLSEQIDRLDISDEDKDEIQADLLAAYELDTVNAAVTCIA